MGPANNNRQHIRNILAVAIGLMCLVAVIAGYCIPIFELLREQGYKAFGALSEYCFIANSAVGCAFLFGGIYGLTKKKAFPSTVYFCCMIVILLMFIATLAFRLNTDGAFAFLHIIDPVCVFLYWCVFCDHTRLPKKHIWAVLIFPAAYIIIVLLYRASVGQFPFPISAIASFGDWYVAAFVPIILIVLVGLGFVFDFLNRRVYKRIDSIKK